MTSILPSLACLLVTAALAAPAMGQPSSPALPSSIVARVESLIAASGAEVAVSFRTLDGTLSWQRRETDVFHAASTYKVAVMLELFHRVSLGQLSLEDRVPVVNQFKSIVDGSPFSLTADSDSDGDLYKAIGESRPYRELCERMITRSSNLATNILIDRLGADRVRATLSNLGIEGISVLRGVEDNLAYEAGKNNTTTARGLRLLLEALAQGRAVSPEASREMLGILERGTYLEAIPAGLPKGTRVAHKEGHITKIQHDAAVVFGPRPYVLVVLVRGLQEGKKGDGLIASITREIHSAVK